MLVVVLLAICLPVGLSPNLAQVGSPMVDYTCAIGRGAPGLQVQAMVGAKAADHHGALDNNPSFATDTTNLGNSLCRPPKLGDHYSTHPGNYFVRTLAGRVATRKYNGFSST
jgi:hypothetical protein